MTFDVSSGILLMPRVGFNGPLESGGQPPVISASSPVINSSNPPSQRRVMAFSHATSPTILSGEPQLPPFWEWETLKFKKIIRPRYHGVLVRSRI